MVSNSNSFVKISALFESAYFCYKFEQSTSQPICVVNFLCKNIPRAEENTGFSSLRWIGMPNFGKSDDDAVQTNAEKLLQEQGETHNFTDPSKANAEVTPKESDGEQTPSLLSDPDFPIETGLYYAFAAGLLYCSRNLYE